MKPLKIIGIAGGVLLALVVAGVAFIASRFDAPRIKSELTRAVQEKKQRTLKIDGELELAFWPNVGVKLGKLSLSEHRSDQPFATIDAARVSVALLPLLSKQVVVDTVAVSGVKATVIKRKDGTLNIDDLLSKDETESAPIQADIAGIRLADVALTWRDEQQGSTTTVSGLDLTTGKLRIDTGRQAYEAHVVALNARGKLDADSFEVRLDAPRLAFAPEGAGGDDLLLTAKLAGAQRSVDARLRLSGIAGKEGTFKVAKASLALDAKAGETALKAALESPLTAEFDAARDRRRVALEKLAGNVEVAHPQMPMKQVTLPLAGHLAADLARPSAEVALTTRFDESKIALRVDVDKFSPLALGFDVDIDRLNLDRYLPPEPAGAGEKKAEDKLDFSALKGLKLDGAIKVGSLQAANVKATNVKLQIKAAGGRLEVAPHSARLYDGTLEGRLALDADGNRLALKENLSGVNIQPLMKDFADKDLIAGRGDIALDVTTRGDSVAAMKQALAGTAAVALKDGALKGIDLARAFRELKAKVSSRQDAEQQASRSEKTDFSKLAASFRIAKGVARNDDLAAKSPFLRLAGRGDIDIGNGRLDYLAKASVVATPGGQGAKDLEHLKGLTVPVRVSGPFDQLAYKIEFGSLAGEAVKAKVEEKTEAVKEQAKKKLLKGIFGR